MKVQVINSSTNELPAYATKGSAGMDLRANITETIILHPMRRALIPTGLKVALPEGYEIQIRPRSGMALKHGITCANTPGTIDSDYRGDVGVILINLSNEPFEIHPGDRIAQMVVSKYEQIEWDSVTELSETGRGDGGFGHSGTK